MHSLAGADMAKQAQDLIQQYDRRVIPIFDEVIKLLAHPVQRDKAQEMRAFLRTNIREAPIFEGSLRDRSLRTACEEASERAARSATAYSSAENSSFFQQSLVR